MAKLIPAAERIVLARALIQKACDLPVPTDGGKFNFSYLAQVKDYLRQAREMVRLIPLTVGAKPEIKDEARKVLQEADQANQEILH